VAAEPTRIVLEVELIEESLIGRASASDGINHEFAGWLGLLRVLEVLLPGPRPTWESDEHWES
jgi:hypothetical protein